jgi:bacillithiol system protein YtxJ
METITTQPALDALLQGGTAILLKHGARCPISASARDRVSTFASAHPELTIYALEVTENRDLARYLADKVGVRHESPQLLLVRDGRAVWHASHHEIDGPSLERNVLDGGGPR